MYLFKTHNQDKYYMYIVLLRKQIRKDDWNIHRQKHTYYTHVFLLNIDLNKKRKYLIEITFKVNPH